MTINFFELYMTLIATARELLATVVSRRSMCRFPLKKPIIQGCKLSETAPRFLSFSSRMNESNNRRPNKWEGSRNGFLLSLFFAFGQSGAYTAPACLSSKYGQIPWLRPIPISSQDRSRQSPFSVKGHQTFLSRFR